METFHENMDSGKKKKKHVCVSAKTLLWVTNNKKKNAANTIPEPGSFPHIVLLGAACNSIEHWGYGKTVSFI